MTHCAAVLGFSCGYALLAYFGIATDAEAIKGLVTISVGYVIGAKL